MSERASERATARVERPTIASFVTDHALPDAAGASVFLGEDAAHHARVRRLAVGDAVSLRDGTGRSGEGRLAAVAKSRVEVAVDLIRDHAAGPPVHLLVPVADRDRMLWLAEKATELGAASWRPVRWHRSRSVSPRGEGPEFARKARARMAAALAQSEGAWLPAVHADAEPARAVAEAPGLRLVLDPDGAPYETWPAADEVTLAIGPEGGFEPAELELLATAGFRRAALPGNILRFETAGVVALALARALVERGTR
ncbi:MAG TPA: RsmE family RNA methyltransferase [Gemmatirosa sp.]|nr:RsmE family RNA methyltransferase [Gemmatirosa sp.]